MTVSKPRRKLIQRCFTRTWVLTSEPVLAPPKELKEACRKAGIPEGCFDVSDLGETKAIDC